MDKGMAVKKGGKREAPIVSDNAMTILKKRYLRVKDGGEVESVAEMHERVARALAKVERDQEMKKLKGKLTPAIEEVGADAKEARCYEEFLDVLSDFSFVPGGRTLANAGTKNKIVSNCVVLSIPDTLEGIFETLKQAALLQKAGSGLGFPLHLMRPAGFPTKASEGVSSGPLSFLHVYNAGFGVIKQQNRHGANLAMMRVDHPDILEFLRCKAKEGDIACFNVSVGLTDEFLRLAEARDPRPWMCEWKGEKMLPRRIKRTKAMEFMSAEPVRMAPHEILREIAQYGYRNGEPGYAFIDAVNRTNPVPDLGRIECCNPCGEQFLHAFDCCNLGALNLARFVRGHTDPTTVDWMKAGNPDEDIDWERLKSVTRTAVRMLDDVVDATDHPVAEVNATARANRRVGLGIMGFADVLTLLRIGYDTDEGVVLAERLMKTIHDTAEAESYALGVEKGSFENYHLSVWKDSGKPRRNCAVTTIAPTGTTSMIADVNGGLEPWFMTVFAKGNILGGVTLLYTNRYLEAALRAHGLYTQEVLQIAKDKGSIKSVETLPAIVRSTFVTAMDITAEAHVRMQAAFQRHLSNSVSKTINAPNEATVDDVERLILLAWKEGLKGCTVYRDGSREVQVLMSASTSDMDVKTALGSPVSLVDDVGASKGAKSHTSKLGGSCDDCKVPLRPEEGCMKCPQCGTGRCSA
jgi:ribonucleoside-diphosphate reductase alpha chain